MSETKFLTFEQIIAIHDSQIENYGGSHGIRELTLLESAAMRPQTTFAANDLYPSLFDKAAALLQSIILNHPFVDGNKRTGIVSALVFLEINGFRVSISQKNLVKLALDVESKKFDISGLSEFLKKNSKKIYE